MLANTGELVAAAAARGVGVGAFNVITLEHAEAIVAGAAQASAPAILQISENAIGYHGGAAAPLAAACLAPGPHGADAGVAAPGPHPGRPARAFRPPTWASAR